MTSEARVVTRVSGATTAAALQLGSARLAHTHGPDWSRKNNGDLRCASCTWRVSFPAAQIAFQCARQRDRRRLADDEHRRRFPTSRALRAHPMRSHGPQNRRLDTSLLLPPPPTSSSSVKCRRRRLVSMRWIHCERAGGSTATSMTSGRLLITTRAARSCC